MKVADEQYILNRDQSGACYLYKDQACSVHAELGGDKKPLACQLYPFQLVPTPAGHHVSMVYSCPAVLAGIGEKIQTYAPELETLLQEQEEHFGQCPFPEDSVPLTQAQVGTWQEYIELEKAILQMLAGKHLFAGLVALACRLVSWSESERQGSIADTAHNSELYLQATELVRCVTVHFLSIFENPEELDARPAFTQGLESPEGVHSNKWQCPLPPFQFQALADSVAEEIALRFVADFLSGKRVWSQNLNLLSSLLMLATSVAVLTYYYQALKANAEQAYFSFEHLGQAFDVVESGLLTHMDDLRVYFTTIGEALEQMHREMS